MFDDIYPLHAFATAFASFGGFPTPPPWFETFKKSTAWQIFMLTVFIYQSGGRQVFWFSLLVAIIFYFLSVMSKYIIYSNDVNKTQQVVNNTQTENKVETETKTEGFYGYY